MIPKKLKLLLFTIISFNGITQDIVGFRYKIISDPELNQYGSVEFYLIDSTLLQLTKNKFNQVESIVLETKSYEFAFNAKFKVFQSKKLNNKLDFRVDTLNNIEDSLLFLIHSSDSTLKKIVPYTVLFDEKSKPKNLNIFTSKLSFFSSQYPVKIQIGYPKPLVVFEKLEKSYLPERISKIKIKPSKRNLKKLVKELNLNSVKNE